MRLTVNIARRIRFSSLISSVECVGRTTESSNKVQVEEGEGRTHISKSQIGYLGKKLTTIDARVHVCL